MISFESMANQRAIILRPLNKYTNFLIGFAAGIVATATVGFAISHEHFSPTTRPLRESDIASSSMYVLTDPLIGLSGVDNQSSDYAPLEQAVESYIKHEQITGVSSVSVNFQDILESEGFSLNTMELYDPASLTKIPLMMAYYSLAEQDPTILSDKILYSGTPNLDADEQIPSPIQLTPGQSYTVEDLIEHLIEHSDNNAEQLLADNLVKTDQSDVLTNLLTDLGIKNYSSGGDDVTVQEYSIFLRVLYNATYLDRNYSEKALRLLTESDFAAGIVGGVPNGIEVAQKFGDAKIANSAGAIVGAELQNCGIVYYPNHPYRLCIMTKGDNVKDLETAIAGISKLIFERVQQRYASSY